MPDSAAAPTRPALEPAEGVAREGSAWVSDGREPWLRLVFSGRVPAGRWVRIVHESSLLDPLCRPLIRFIGAKGTSEQVMGAALFGRGVWLGRVPAGTRDILISPVDRPGRFGFRLVSMTVVPHLAVIAQGLRRDPFETLHAGSACLIGGWPEAYHLMQFALGGEPFERYDAWRRGLARLPEPDGLEAPRFDWSRGPAIRLVTTVDRPDDPALARLVAVCVAQPYPNWSILAVTGESGLGPDAADRLRRVAPGTGGLGAALAETCAPDDLVWPMAVDDAPAPYALAALAERAAAAPVDILYGDEDFFDGERHQTPLLKPDWSPALAARSDYTASAVAWRWRVLAAHSDRLDGLTTPAGRATLLRASGTSRVEHLARILITHRGTMASPAPVPTIRISRPRSGDGPAASIIIPTKDRPELIAACIDGLRRRTRMDRFEVLIVDNGSEDPATLRLYESLADNPRFRILSRPGRFNFSAMCNAAAAVATAPVLVFLNNDIAMVDEGWLEPLLDWAREPGVGAVGAKLLYPDGRIQHAGVALGMGGQASHVEIGKPGNHVGYLGRLAVPHEVGAVTGACIAVDATKFHAVGGFDAENLPVELNDIDLCLKLDEQGWRTIYTPESVLIHHHSASRGFSYKPFSRYERERRYFRSRWMHRIRHDPYFHPALSLFCSSPALG